MDVLGDILRVIRLRGSVYFNACFCSPWGMNLQHSPRSAFHLIVKGEAWLKMPSLERPLKLVLGDIVLLPKGAAHTISDKPDTECLPGEQVVEAYQNGRALFSGERDDFNIVCGYVEFDRFFSHPFFASLPECIHITANCREQFFWLDNVIKQIIVESMDNKPGSDVLVDKFTEILFIQVIRAYVERAGSKVNYLTALMDRQLSKALVLIHNEPEKEWSIEQLAQAAGLSRSAFYNRFNDYVGLAPMKYLYEWRMMQAKQKIENTQKPIAIVAEEVGYNSDSAFQKAFKRFFNFTPASLRKK